MRSRIGDGYRDEMPAQSLLDLNMHHEKAPAAVAAGASLHVRLDRR